MIDTPQGLTVVSRDSDRTRLSQSGLIDANLLCSEHEQATEAYDKYGVEFCRAFEQLAVPTETGNGFTVPNPKPQMLARFIYACVWRYVTSRYGTEVALNLGRYEAIMRGCIFEGAECTLPVIVGLSHLRDSNGEPQTICVAPFYSRAAPANRWVLTIGYLDFAVFCDNRPIAHKFAGALANADDPLLCGKTDGQLFTQARVLRPLINQMVKTV